VFLLLAGQQLIYQLGFSPNFHGFLHDFGKIRKRIYLAKSNQSSMTPWVFYGNKKQKPRWYNMGKMATE
jgi:hypothetical protein